MSEYRTDNRTSRQSDYKRDPAASRYVSPHASTRPAHARRPAYDDEFNSSTTSRKPYSSRTSAARPQRYSAPAGRSARDSEYRSQGQYPRRTSTAYQTAPQQRQDPQRSAYSSAFHIKSIIAMGLGISSVAVSWAYLYGSIYAIAAAIAALLLTKADIKAGIQTGATFRKTAKITGIIGICAGGISFIIWLIIAIVAASAYSALKMYY